MKNDKLSLIGSRIREIRNEKSMGLRELAKRSKLSPGLISKIENFRTVPSLSVLIEIANALEVDVARLVKDLNGESEAPYILIRDGEGKPEKREDSKGLIYSFLLSQNIANYSIRVNLVTVKPNTHRKPVSTSAYELIHVIEGEASYGFKNEEVTLTKGDTIYFDGRLAHSVKNAKEIPAKLFKIYFIRHTD
ncbi:MAG: helix-turn-helix transcriptional regulator [Ferruginibacter sp.]|nr:helix-turn-helix transcriptional regulator [Cytophagales bacterium]